MLNIDKEVWLQ